MMNVSKTCYQKPWIPLPLSFVGVHSQNGPEYSLVQSCGVLCVTPPTIYISLHRSHHLHAHISKKGMFSINTPSASFFSKVHPELKGETGDVVQNDAIDKFYSDISDAPMIRQCPINLACRVVDTIDIHEMSIFVSRVEKTYIDSRRLTEGNRNPHMDRIDPVIWTPGNKFWGLGRLAGDAFSIGNCYGKGLLGILKHYARANGKSTILKAYSAYLSLKNSAARVGTEEKTEIPARSLIYPLPVILLGTNVDDKPNYSVVVNCGIVNNDPPILCVSSMKSHHTNTGIRQNDSFSVNVPDISLVRKTDYCGIVSGKKVDKSGVFKTFYGEDKTIPMIEACPVNIVCRVIKVYPVKHMEVFIGEVVKTNILKKCMTLGKPDIKKIDPILYALNLKYWSAGPPISRDL